MSKMSTVVFEVQELYEQAVSVQDISNKLDLPLEFVKDIVSSIWDYE
jgi:RNAse (barnase) inhibitor barstar